MKEFEISKRILGLTEPWRVEQVTLKVEAREVEVRVGLRGHALGLPRVSAADGAAIVRLPPLRAVPHSRCLGQSPARSRPHRHLILPHPHVNFHATGPRHSAGRLRSKAIGQRNAEGGEPEAAVWRVWELFHQ